MRPIKEIFDELLKSGKVKGHLEGPRNNVLVCDTVKDWVDAGHIISQEGWDIRSPGGYGGSAPNNRKNTWHKMWHTGSVFATVVERHILCFKLPQDIIPLSTHTDIVHESGNYPLKK